MVRWVENDWVFLTFVEHESSPTLFYTAIFSRKEQVGQVADENKIPLPIAQLGKTLSCILIASKPMRIYATHLDPLHSQLDLLEDH